MADPIVLGVVVVGARLAYALVELWTAPVRTRAEADAVATLLRAAGPGGMVETTAPDGSVTTVRTAPDAELAEAGR